MTRYTQTIAVNVEFVDNFDVYDAAAAVRRLPGVSRAFVNWDYTETRAELPEVNRAKLIEVAQWAAGQQALKDLGLPSEWSQASWLSEREGVAAGGWCGTACCIAGKVALDAGWKPILHTFDDGSTSLSSDTRVVKEIDGQLVTRDVAAVAREVLQLTGDDDLFSGSNGLDDVIRIVGELIAE